jgi:hypothetical protein
MSFLLLDAMTNPTFARLPAEKCKLMLDTNNPTCFYSKIGEGHNQFGVYCLPSEFMSIVCPCGIIKNSYTTIMKHLKVCQRYKDFCDDVDDDDDVDVDVDVDGGNHLDSISLETYKESATNPKVGWYSGKLYLYYHHKYTYVCPCGHSAQTKIPSAGYHNLGNSHFALCRKSPSDGLCCEFVNNILKPSTASTSCFHPSASDFVVVVKKKRKSMTKPTLMTKKRKVDDDLPIPLPVVEKKGTSATKLTPMMEKKGEIDDDVAVPVVPLPLPVVEKKATSATKLTSTTEKKGEIDDGAVPVPLPGPVVENVFDF